MINLNSSRQTQFSQQPIDLKQAVQQQLDLILKMQEDRKALKKQNKFLSQKLTSLNQVIRKYQVDTAEQSVNTDALFQTNTTSQNKVTSNEQSVQVQIENLHPNITINNHSKISQAHSLLKVLDLSIANKQSKHCFDSNSQKFQLQRQIQQKKSISNNNNNINSKQITNQVVKMSKQINSLKRELKQSQHRNKLKQKQIKQIKKCLQTKSQTLEKSRKDFNELSNLLNTDKYKSIRNLENQMKLLKSKLVSKQQQQQAGKHEQLKQVKHFLAQITQQYEDYKNETDGKLEILVSELANKQKQNQELQAEQRKLLKKLQYSAST